MPDLMQLDKSRPADWQRGVATMFCDIADSYEKINTFISLGMDQGWRRLLLHRLAAYAELRHPVLDIGCGPGSIAKLARRELPQARIIGGDISWRFLQIAANSGNCREIARLSASALPFKAASLGAVTSAFVLRNLPDLELFYRECHRTLKPGGVISMLDLTQPAFRPLAWGHNLYMRLMLPLGAKLYGSKVEAYHYLDRSIKNCLSAKEMNSLLEKCGFEILHTDRRCLGSVTLYTARKKG